MDKKIFICLFVYLFICLFPRLALAKGESDDYVFQQEKYRQVYENFTTAREKYLKYKTLSAKDEAVKETKTLINQRCKTLRVYFLALKQKLKITAKVVSSKQREALISKLDKEINWLMDQNEQIEQLLNPSLDDLFIISDRFENKKAYFESLSYQSLSAVLLGKSRNLSSESIVITTLLADKINQLEATRSAYLPDWLREVENKNYLGQKEIEVAESKQELLIRKKDKQLLKVYSEIQINLKKAKEYLNQAFSFQQEIYSYFNNGTRI